MFAVFNHLSEKEKNEAVRDLIHDSTPRPSFFLLIILSVLMATFGLLINNASVIIGSMLIAPILSPILSLSMGIVMSDNSLMSRAALTLAKALGVGMVLAAIATIFVSIDSRVIGDEVMSRTTPSLIYFAIAFVAGLAAAFARVNPDLSDTIPGIAISVALIPPLAVAGIGIAIWDWHVFSGAAMLVLVNIIGIVFATMLVFSMMNLYVKREVAAAAVKKEDAVLAEQIKNGKKK